MPSCGLPLTTARALVVVAGEQHDAAASSGRAASWVVKQRAVVGRPRAPEQVALPVAGRVVGELLKKRVQDLEAAGQAGVHRRQVLGGGPQVAHGRLGVARERPQLVADDRRRVAQERPLWRAGTAPARARRAAAPAASGRARPRGCRVAQRGRRSARACPGTARSASRRPPPAARTPRSSRWRSRRSSRQLVSFGPSSVDSAWKVWMTRLDVGAPLGEQPGDCPTSRAVGSKRLNVSRRSAGRPAGSRSSRRAARCRRRSAGSRGRRACRRRAPRAPRRCSRRAACWRR